MLDFVPCVENVNTMVMPTERASHRIEQLGLWYPFSCRVKVSASDQVGKRERKLKRIPQGLPVVGRERRAAKTTAKTTRKKRSNTTCVSWCYSSKKVFQVYKRSGTRRFLPLVLRVPHSCTDGHKGHCKRQKSTSAYRLHIHCIYAQLTGQKSGERKNRHLSSVFSPCPARELCEKQEYR